MEIENKKEQDLSTAEKLQKLEELWEKEKKFLESLGVEVN